MAQADDDALRRRMQQATGGSGVARPLPQRGVGAATADQLNTTLMQLMTALGGGTALSAGEALRRGKLAAQEPKEQFKLRRRQLPKDDSPQEQKKPTGKWSKLGGGEPGTGSGTTRTRTIADKPPQGSTRPTGLGTARRRARETVAGGKNVTGQRKLTTPNTFFPRGLKKRVAQNLYSGGGSLKPFLRGLGTAGKLLQKAPGGVIPKLAGSAMLLAPALSNLLAGGTTPSPREARERIGAGLQDLAWESIAPAGAAAGSVRRAGKSIWDKFRRGEKVTKLGLGDEVVDATADVTRRTPDPAVPPPDPSVSTRVQYGSPSSFSADVVNKARGGTAKPRGQAFQPNLGQRGDKVPVPAALNRATRGLWKGEWVDQTGRLAVNWASTPEVAASSLNSALKGNTRRHLHTLNWLQHTIKPLTKLEDLDPDMQKRTAEAVAEALETNLPLILKSQDGPKILQQALEGLKQDDVLGIGQTAERGYDDILRIMEATIQDAGVRTLDMTQAQLKRLLNQIGKSVTRPEVD